MKGAAVERGALLPHPALTAKAGIPGELCQLVADWTGALAPGASIVEPKMDGMRALWINGDLVTREGVAIAGAEHIEAELMRLERAAAVPLFFDGEFQVGGNFATTLAHFGKNGADGHQGVLWAFDMMPARVWHGEDSGEALEVRRPKLDRMLSGATGPVRSLPWAWMTDRAEIEGHARDYIAVGGEGVVVKQAGAVYRRGRSTIWQRIKKAITLDLEIVGYEAERARSWLLGSIICDLNGKRVRVHAGFSDRERLELWRTRADLVGLIAEIEAMEMTEKGSLRSARFLRLRPDKLKGRE